MSAPILFFLSVSSRKGCIQDMHYARPGCYQSLFLLTARKRGRDVIELPAAHHPCELKACLRYIASWPRGKVGYLDARFWRVRGQHVKKKIVPESGGNADGQIPRCGVHEWLLFKGVLRPLCRGLWFTYHERSEEDGKALSLI